MDFCVLTISKGRIISYYDSMGNATQDNVENAYEIAPPWRNKKLDYIHHAVR